MDLFDKALGIHAEALKFRSQRGAVLAANIANSATPGFQARDYDFRSALKTASNDARIQLQTSRPGHLAASDESEFGTLLYRVPTRTSEHNNTVEAEVEQAAFSENALRYQASLRFLSGSISGLRKAIRGE
ncbi:MAG: flagellar basal body rod protein FlgB [Pseudomonadales bacterium]|nr:flagellar basal body rod protein FlgB [Pseudomonadales bacterium]